MLASSTEQVCWAPALTCTVFPADRGGVPDPPMLKSASPQQDMVPTSSTAQV